jgi:hypothetical protein
MVMTVKLVFTSMVTTSLTMDLISSRYGTLISSSSSFLSLLRVLIYIACKQTDFDSFAERILKSR